MSRYQSPYDPASMPKNLEHVIYEKKGHVAYVTINRPEVLNSLHSFAYAELRACWRDMGIDPESDPRLVEVLNKIDLLDHDGREHALAQFGGASGRAVAVSALTGDGLERLFALLDRIMTAEREVLEVSVTLYDGAALSWLYGHGEVVERRDDEERAHLKVALEPADRARFEHRYPAYLRP